MNARSQQMNTKNRSITRFARPLRIALVLGTLLLSPLASAQKIFASPEAASDALVDGIARHDGTAVRMVIGADYAKYVPVSDLTESDITAFLEAWSQAHGIVRAGDAKAFLSAGKAGWTLPVPIVKSATGWRFDTKLAGEEMRTRRIGRNELAAIQVALAYSDAQDEYAARDLDGDGVRQYATRPLSSRGKRDGLYWASLPDEPASPLGPAFADAKPGQPYHGYVYKILTAQGKDAPGGAKSYVKNGKMTEGYALIAWPAKYGDTGVMTFVVNKDGVVYQKDLGPGTATLARTTTAYNPDASWSKAASK
jgi:hypothetical protein